MKATLRIIGDPQMEKIEKQVQKVNEEIALLRQMVRALSPCTMEIEGNGDPGTDQK